MELNYLLLLRLSWTLILIVCATTDLEVKATANTGLDPKNPLTLNNNNKSDEKTGRLETDVDYKKVDQVKNDKDQVGGSKEVIQNNELNDQNSIEKKQDGSKEDQSEKKGEDGSVVEGDKREKSGPTKEVPVKERSRGEECDVSKSCKDDKNKLVACLRVPGNDSPDLSLLIQNKGNNRLSVTISASDFVVLEKTKIQLPEKEDIKVKVSIKSGGTDNFIVLKAGEGNCSLDFGDLIPRDFNKETDHSTKTAYINLVKKPPLAVFIVFGVLLIMVSAWMCVSFQRRHFNKSNGSKYQKLDAELPVSGGSKAESDLNDGWDNSWGDDWDDEEAPKTPSMPVTPSLSSKGLASRRFNKDGWKD
ncbi:hypothetical protein LOK49_LG13G01023 [Camellia lanceoleosa]|uniref:Uncharacterized protein n=1 Tax=Camellia lanceoleosa TaxID=1840588 RepID=A0ACC0FMM0_9ERIC|nr:hypothetical protein LOK49_LG13G01023 [Camellia lanceoleosa]